MKVVPVFPNPLARISIAAVVLVLACGDQTTEPRLQAPAGPAAGISDAVHDVGGNPGFYWLAPMVSQPVGSSLGTFQSGLRPMLQVICLESSEGACEPGAVVAEFGPATGLTEESDHYQLDLDTGAHGLHLSANGHTTIYRIVALTDPLPELGGPFELGYADIALAANAREAQNLSSDELIGLVDGRTLPVKFRIEVGAYEHELQENGATAADDPGGALCQENCSVTVVPADEPTRAALADEETGEDATAVFFESGDVATTSFLVIDERTTADMGDETCAEGLTVDKKYCYRYKIFPDVAFENLVRMGICPRGLEIGGSSGHRLLKADHENGAWTVTEPDPVDVSDFLPCTGLDDVATGPLGSLLRYALDWLVPPLHADAERVWGGMVGDFSDIFWSLDTPESPPALISRWTADATVPDAYGDVAGGNHGVVTGWVPLVDGVEGTDAFGFDGDGSVLTAPADGWGAASRLTVSTWVELDPTGPREEIQRFVTLGHSTTGYPKAVLRQNNPDPAFSGRQLHFYMAFGIDDGTGNSLHHITVEDALSTGCWQHVAGTYDGGVMRVYLDAQLIGQLAIDPARADSSSVADHMTLSSAFLGDGAQGPEALHGALDDVRIYNYDLSQAEIQALVAAEGPPTCARPLVVDQEQPVIEESVQIGIGGIEPNQHIAQTFTAGLDGAWIHQVEVPVQCSPVDGDDLTLQIQGVDGSGQPDGVALSSTVIDGDDLAEFSEPPVFRTLPLATPVQVDAGTQYAVVMSVPSPGDCTLRGRGPDGDPYTGGDGFHTTSPGDGWTPFSEHETWSDIPFRILVEQ